MGWLIERLTGSVGMQGLVGSLAQLPSLVLPPFSGAVADQFDRKRLLVLTQTLAMMQALGLSAIVFTGHVRIWHLIVFNVLLSAVNAFDMPTRQTFIGDMLEDREDLANAIAINSSMVNGARLIGPALAATMIAIVGEAGGFLINGLSFFAVIFALAAMRIPRHRRVSTRSPLRAGMAEGWRHVSRRGPIRLVLFVVAAVSFFGLPYQLLLPRFTRGVLGGGPAEYALLMTAPGLGAFCGALLLMWLGFRHMTVRIAGAPIIAGTCLAGMSLCHSLATASVLLFFCGFGLLLVLNSANTLLQAIAPPEQRGRVMSYYAVSFTGMAPMGNLVVPSLGEFAGIPVALQVGGAACVLAGIAFAFASPAHEQEIESRLRQDRRERYPQSASDSSFVNVAVIPRQGENDVGSNGAPLPSDRATDDAPQ